MSWMLAYTIVAWIVRAGMVPVVLRRQMAPGASLAWLGIVFLHPYIGLTLYMLVGEARLGPRRVQLYCEVISRARARGNTSGTGASTELSPPYEPMVLQAEKISGMPVLPGNAVEFLPSAPDMLQRLIADIDRARCEVHLIYYIFAADTTGLRLAAALKNAAGRGVKCRVIADAVASRTMLYPDGLADQMRRDQIEVVAALPVNPLARGLPRMDLRNHRKLAVIDGRIGYAGSHNMIDPNYGGRRGGPWVDLSGRFTGPVVDELAVVFREDWTFETGKQLESTPIDDLGHLAGDTSMQVVPTGPSEPGKTYRRVLLAAIQCARQRLTLTTPYFVPDETTLISLMMAADRGVEVTIILPAKPDHFFTAAAGRAHFGKLMEAGVRIFLYGPGLLHAKTATVDDAFAIFGSANLDVRSFNLNFELSILLYGKEVTDRLRAVQETYREHSVQLDAAEWAMRSTVRQTLDGAISLLSPLL